MIFKLLAYITTFAGIAKGIQTGVSAFRGQTHDRNLVVFGITVFLHCFFWSCIYTLPVYLLQKVWWLAIIVIIIELVIYFSKSKS